MSLVSCPTPDAARRATRLYVASLTLLAGSLASWALLKRHLSPRSEHLLDFLQGALLGAGLTLLVASFLLRKRTR